MELMTSPFAAVIVLQYITWRILAVHLIGTLLIAIPTAVVAFGLLLLAMRLWNPYILKLRERDRAGAENKT